MPHARRNAAPSLACACWLLACAQALAADAPAFNTRFLKLDGQAADLKAVLNAGNNVLPGSYRVDILLNHQLADRRDILFRQQPDGKVRPCLDAALLRKLGVKLPASGAGDEACVDLPRRLEHAQVRYDSTRLQLELSVPQAHLLRRADGYVDPALWDAGVNAAYANYQLSSQYSRGQDDRASRQFYLGLQNGLNLGDWRLRNDATLSWNTGQAAEIRSNRTLLQRDITALRSQLTLGEQYTDAVLFDSVRIRGAQLSQDDAMLPDSERGYRPVVRGQAQSQATVEVRQNGYVLHRADVPPGPFEFTDITPSGSNGELEITVTEADGSRRVSHQSFSSLPLMQARGRWKYHAALGQYQGGEAARPGLAAGALVYGLSDDSTVAAGFQLSPRFQAVNLGLGANTPLGALSLDLSQSLSRAQGGRSQGQSLRLLYHKALPSTQTQLTLAAYRYSTAGYRSFNDHAADLARRANQHRARARIDLSAQQTLGREGRRGSLYLSLSRQNYWGRPGASHSLNLAYSHRWKQFHYHLSLSRSRDGRGQGSSQIMLGFSLPLDTGRRAPQLSAQLGRNALHTSLSGQLGEADSYTVSVSRDSQGGASLRQRRPSGRCRAAERRLQHSAQPSIRQPGRQRRRCRPRRRRQPQPRSRRHLRPAASGRRRRPGRQRLYRARRRSALPRQQPEPEQPQAGRRAGAGRQRQASGAAPRRGGEGRVQGAQRTPRSIQSASPRRQRCAVWRQRRRRRRPALGHRGPARPDATLAHAAARPAGREMERRRLHRSL
nr:fimbria/pilus outer membrane usher protein [Chromobacterium haemolyticum]